MTQNNGPSTGNEMILSPRQEKLVALRDEMAPGYRPAAIVPRTFAEIELMCKALAGANLVPKAFKDKPTDMILVVMTGLEVGIPPMAALRLYTTWDGVPRLMAEGIRGILLAHPDIEYFEPASGDDKHATWIGKRRGRPEKSATWTIERAKRAGLLSKDVWQKYPEDMLNARASMQLGRMIAPDIVAGMVSREEASDGDFIDAQATETRSAPVFVAPPSPATNTAAFNPSGGSGGGGGAVVILGTSTTQIPPGFSVAPVVGSTNAGEPVRAVGVTPQGPPPGVPQPPEKPKRERGAAAVRPTTPAAGSSKESSPPATVAQQTGSSEISSSSNGNFPVSSSAAVSAEAAIAAGVRGGPTAPIDEAPERPISAPSTTAHSPSAESAQTSSPASGAAAPEPLSQSAPDDFGGEDPVDTQAPADPVEAKLAEFHAWLKGCATQRDLAVGLGPWRAWSKEMSDVHNDTRFRKGGEITNAMQDAYSKRKGEVPA